MGLDSVPGRVTLLVTSQLTLVTMFASSLSAAIPPVAYLKAIDYWMLYCLFFLFLAQIEFVVVKVLDVLYRYERTGSYYNNPGAANSKPLKKKRPKDESASSSLQSSSSSTSGAFKGLAGIFRRTNTTGAWSVDHEARKQHQEEIKLQLEQENSDTDYQDQRGFCNLHLGWIDEKGRERLLWREIDIAFRFIFPILFGIFNLVFWPMLYKRHF
ncbi:unnamed protein product [Notodromas monacha]|uniref:Neurotransmitter-gated ion-channel transmembrane domain-containing protein n=1 Tax=Notodromas monacha TaxID=399045 RepID=A0A7R9C169_9CRUS|nr:unnamed protein product [Notodromas monacha]CAG0925548.1 unnamed protein product [Notodromas monacha]